MSKTGIYKIKNNQTDDFYIGSSKNIISRLNNHKKLLLLNKHANCHLQNAWNKYGSDSFEFITIEECSTDILLAREQYYIDFLQPKYNICLIAGAPSLSEPWNKGKKGLYKHSKEQLKKMRGRTPWNKGKIASKETREKLSISHKGQIAWNKGKKCSQFYKSRKGKKLSEEHKDKIRLAHLGFHHSEETKIKIGKASSARWAALAAIKELRTQGAIC